MLSKQQFPLRAYKGHNAQWEFQMYIPTLFNSNKELMTVFARPFILKIEILILHTEEKYLRKMCCLCIYICKWLDILVFSDKDEK